MLSVSLSHEEYCSWVNEIISAYEVIIALLCVVPFTVETSKLNGR